MRYFLAVMIVAVWGCAAPPGPPPAGPAPAAPPAEALRAFLDRLHASHPDLAMGDVAPDDGMHLSDVTDADVDAAETLVVSGSDDKTARIWALDTGRLLQVLRFPATGDTGKVFAVAMSPDGKVAAVGGWGGRIYLFATASGALVGVVKPRAGSVHSLRFSPDGRRLAAGFYSRNGIRVFETEGYREVLADRDYGGDCYGLAFSATGHLVVASWDGTVRLYAPDGALMAKRNLGDRPFRVAFDPRGEMVLVGHLDQSGGTVLSVPALDVVRELAIPPRSQRDSFGTVAWSRDGGTLYMSGRWEDEQGKNRIIRWARDGQRLEDWILHENTPSRLAPLAGGGLVVASQDPLVGVLGPDGAARWVRRPAMVDFTGQARTLRFSPDGAVVEFAWKYKEPSRLAFDARRLSFVKPDAAILRAPVTSEAGFDVASWEDAMNPTAQGRPLAVKRFETCRALAIDAPRDRFVLGCEWHLYAFGRTGTPLWTHAIGGSIRGAFVSTDGRLTVVAMDDGTLHWMRTDDGKNLLTAFFHDRGQQWVAWTPEGFFTGSPFGESLLGINGLRRDGTGDMIPLVEFAAELRRPDLVGRALD